MHDGQIVAGAEEIIGEKIGRLTHCRRSRRTAPPGGNLLSLGQRYIENVDSDSANRLDSLFGAAALQTCTCLG